MHLQYPRHKTLHQLEHDKRYQVDLIKETMVTKAGTVLMWPVVAVYLDYQNL